jgi:hypothetical protein
LAQACGRFTIREEDHWNTGKLVRTLASNHPATSVRVFEMSNRLFRKDDLVRHALTRDVVSVASGLVLFVALSASGQTSSPPAQVSPGSGPDKAPLSRYVPAKNVIYYFECDGLDSHAEAWAQTSTYKILNDTPTGAMLEEVLAQWIEHNRKQPPSALPQAQPSPAMALAGPGAYLDQALTALIPRGAATSLNGTEIVAALKEMLNGGFVFACVGSEDPKSPISAILVIRGGGKKGVREPYIKTLGASAGPDAKFAASNKGQRRIYTVDDPKSPSGAKKWGWFVEKDDLVVGLSSLSAMDQVIATLDGKTPNASTLSSVADLTKPESGFQPIVGGFIDFETFTKNFAPNPAAPPAMAGFSEKAGIKLADFRWGIDGKTVMSVSRLKIPSPRPSYFQVIDNPSFSARSTPPMPAGVSDFKVVSMNLKTIYPRLLESLRPMSPSVVERIEQFAETFKTKTKLSLTDDVLGRLGPKFAFYSLPAKKGALSVGLQVPKATMLVEVSDATAFGKALDELMGLANKELKTTFAALSGGTQPAANERKGGSSADSTIPVFRMSPGTLKTYILKLPPQYAALTNLELTITVGKKYVAISTTPVAAREAMAVETKTEGRYKPDPQLAASLDKLPKELIYLAVDDPTETLPAGLAAFPTSLQMRLSPPAMLAASGGANGSGAGGQPPPDSDAGGPGMRRRGGAGRPVGAGPVGASPAGGSSSSGGQSQGLVPAAPAGGSAGSSSSSSGGSPATSGALSALVIRVDPSKIPSVDSTKAFLFPGEMAASVDSQGVTVTTRAAFPYLLQSLVADPGVSSITQLLQGGQLAKLQPGAANPPGTANNPPGQRAPGRNGPAGNSSGGARPGSID